MSIDPHVIEGTDVPLNVLGATTQRELGARERPLVAARTIELLDDYQIRATGDSTEIAAIHAHLFQDVYPWAGQFRQSNIAKIGGKPFVGASEITDHLDNIGGALQRANGLRGMDHEKVSDRLAKVASFVNSVHPFREGNGRTMRVFLTRVARDAGWDLDWSKVTHVDNDLNSAQAHQSQDHAVLREQFKAMLAPARTPEQTTVSPAGAGQELSGRRLASVSFSPSPQEATYRRPTPPELGTSQRPVSVEGRAVARGGIER